MELIIQWIFVFGAEERGAWERPGGKAEKYFFQEAE